MNKLLKFSEDMSQQVSRGEKTSTWRLFPDKEYKVGEIVDLVDKSKMQIFAEAEITSVEDKSLSEINDLDYEGHQKYSSQEEMFADLQKFYPDQKVDGNTQVKIIKFKKLENMGRFLGNVSVRYLLHNKKNNTVLVTRDPSDMIFEIPGGRLEKGENIEICMVREAKEEMDVDLDFSKATYFYSNQNVHTRDGMQKFFVVFLVEVDPDNLPEIKNSREVGEYRWVSKDDYEQVKYFYAPKLALDELFK